MDWIKLTDKLPEKDVTVLLFNGVVNETYGLGAISDIDEDGVFSVYSKQSIFNQCKEYKPTHWMPLEAPVEKCTVEQNTETEIQI
jgi:hypothetical protein